MKKIGIFISILFFLFVNQVFADDFLNNFSQKIYLYPGWNIVSTPRILENYSFSVSETSDNFDIYILNPESPSGWSTMAELGQNTFKPLFGYFINNKTGDIQTLTFNYVQDLEPNKRLFNRSFLKTGWYSIGVANPTYVKSRYDMTSIDFNNPASILYSLLNKISAIIDFTNDNNYPWIVKVSSNWKGVNPSNLNDLNDFRDTKGYAVFINNAENALYQGFQNNDPINDPINDDNPLISRFEVSKNSGSPVSNNVIADYSNGRADKVALLKVDLTAKNDRVQLTQLSGSSTFSGTGSVGTLYLMDGSNVLDSASLNSGSYTFSNLLSQNIWVEKDTTKTLTIAADITGATTSVTQVSATVSSVSRKNSLGDTGSDAVTGATGDTLYVFTEAPTFAKGGTFKVSVTRDQNLSTTTANTTLEVMITARGGSIKVSSSTVFSLFRETSAGVTTTIAKAASDVRDSSNNVVSQDANGFYVIPVNQTYKFVIQDSYQYAGAATLRVKINSITWRNSANTDVTSNWVGRDLITDWSN